MLLDISALGESKVITKDIPTWGDSRKDQSSTVATLNPTWAAFSRLFSPPQGHFLTRIALLSEGPYFYSSWLQPLGGSSLPTVIFEQM
jgi:hypothetical protein